MRRRPDWPKAHFRRAEALAQAGLHVDALASYETGSRLDPEDDHLCKQCTEARLRQKHLVKKEQLCVVAGAMIGVLLLLLLVLAPGSEPAPGKKGPPPPGIVSYTASVIFGAVLGALAAVGAVALQRHNRRGLVLPPLESNERFAAMQMRNDRDGAGPLRSKVRAGSLEKCRVQGNYFRQSSRVFHPCACRCSRHLQRPLQLGLLGAHRR